MWVFMFYFNCEFWLFFLLANMSECTEHAVNAVAGLYGKWIKDSFEGDYINTTALDTLFFSFQLSLPFRFQKDLRPLCFFNLVLPLPHFAHSWYLSLSCSLSLSFLVSVSLLLSSIIFFYLSLVLYCRLHISYSPSPSIRCCCQSFHYSMPLFSLTVSPSLSCQEFMTTMIGES